MRVVEVSEWAEHWHKQDRCPECRSLLEIDEDDLIPQAMGNSPVFECPVCKEVICANSASEEVRKRVRERYRTFIPDSGGGSSGGCIFAAVWIRLGGRP